jgi:hypothetical protein
LSVKVIDLNSISETTFNGVKVLSFDAAVYRSGNNFFATYYRTSEHKRIPLLVYILKDLKKLWKLKRKILS